LSSRIFIVPLENGNPVAGFTGICRLIRFAPTAMETG
jgi:hypothetical protein